MQMIHKIVAGALALVFSGASLATDGLPPVRTFGSVSYITGGIGLDESTAIKAAEKDFALSLTFAATKRREYLSDVKVSIKDNAGKTVLEAVSDGPMLLARLPAGAYKITAEHDGNALSKTVRVEPRGVTRTAFVWQPAREPSIE
jgi:hypothetical protein